MQQESGTTAFDVDFIDFMKTAKQDTATAEQLGWLLSFDATERKQVLGTLIGRLSGGEAPDHLVNAMRLLLNDKLADTARVFLASESTAH